MSLNTLLYAVVIATIYAARLSSSASLSFTIEPSDHVVAIGQPLLLNCQAQYSGSESVVISWNNNNAWLLDPANKPWSQLSNHSLYYSSIPALSIGTFFCGAMVTGTSQIKYSRTATVQAAYIKSQYLTHPHNVTKRLGEVATFDCVIEESLPYASIQWQKNGKPFTEGEVAGSFHIPSTKATSSALSVRNITFSSAGWYGCVAVNPLLPNQPQSSKKAYLTVLPGLDRPHFGVHPTNMIVPEHLPAIMQCQILGVPPPMISWTMNGQPVSNVSDRYILSNGSLYFAPPVNRSYAGQYVCSGTNSAGSVSSVPVFFRVAYFDFIFKENPSNQTAVVGDAVSMKCIPPVSFPVQLTIRWYHKYQLITPGGDISIDSSGTIKFTAIKKSDDGMYFCDGTNSDLQATRTSSLAYVTVYVPPTFQVQPRDTNVTQGHPLTLHCQATGFPLPIITWQKDGQPVDTNHVTLLSNGSLHISSTVVQDAGKFSCIATNVAGSPSVIADVVIYVPPSLVSSAANVTKTVGESVKFECSFNGIPKPDIQWFYASGGSTVQLKQTNHYVISAGSLEIRQIMKEDEGRYICRAVNVAGRLESSAYLRVKVPASLDINPVNVTVNESSSASFKCNASGDPKPVVTWFKDGGQLTTGGRIVIGGDSLTVLSTVASDAGQYSCNVSNGLSSHVGIAHLLVQVAPNITSFHVPRLVMLGMSATLTCAVSGIPQPSVTWHRSGVALSVTSSQFVIGNVRDADSGVYTCIASNAAGRKSKHGNLTVQVSPSPPFPISATPVSSTVIQLSWRPGFDGHSSITGYKLEIKRESGTYVVREENISVTSYTVRNLDPYTTYTFRISARNTVGLSPGATVANQTLQDAPSPPATLVALPSNNATAISLTWSEPTTPNGQLTRYEIQYNAAGSSDVTSKVLSANQLPVLKTLIDSLKPFTVYQFRIRAATGEKDVMWGNFSALAEARTGEAAPDAAPQDIQLQALSSDSVLVKWKSVPSELTNGKVRKYIIFVKATGPYRFSDAKNFSTDTSLNFTIRGLFPWTKYNVSVQAFTVQGGPMSPWKQAWTLEAAPGPPSNVTLVSDSQHSIMVYIAQPVPLMRNGIIRGYTVFYRQTNLSPEVGYLSVNTTVSPTRLFNLTVYTQYSVKVAAFTNAGLGDTSEVKTIFSQEGVPGTVDDVTATAVNHDTIKITWRPPETPNGKITQYMVTYNTADGNASRSVTTEDDELTVNIDKLTPNTTYYIFVTAKTSKGFGRRGTIVNATTRILPPPTTMPTEPQTTPTEESNTTNAVPVGTEKSTDKLDREQMIIIIVCVGLIVLFLTVAAVYFLIIRRWREQKAVKYKKSRKIHEFRSGYELDRPPLSGFHGSAVLDVHEEPSVADTNPSSDSFDSDWNSSVASPSPVKPTPQYADPVDASTPHAPDRSPQVNLRNKKVSLDSQGSHYDQPYSSVEELGGGFSSFGPLPPVAFRSSPIDERGSESPGSRKSFTNKLYNPASEPKAVDLGEGSRASEGYPNKDISGMENKGYDTDEELDRRLAASNGRKSTSSAVTPPNLDDLYAKPDKSKKKTFRKKEAPSSSDTDSNHSSTQTPSKIRDSYAKPDKSKKTFRKVSSDPQGNQAPRQADEPGHDPVVVYDERTNFSAEAERKNSNPGVDRHDLRSVGESTFSSVTVSDLNSSEAADGSEDLINLSLELPLTKDNEALPTQDLGPPPSPYTLRSKRISLGSQDSFYDEPYSNLEEIEAGSTPVVDFSAPPPSTFGSTIVDEIGSETEEEPKVLDLAPTISRTSFPNEPYGVVDKSEEEAVVMEVKEIENMADPTKETENTINDFDEVLNSLLDDELPTETGGNQNMFTRTDSYDSTVLMF